MSVIEDLRSIYRQLAGDFDAEGRGAISRTLKAAGLSRNYWSRIWGHLAAGKPRRFDLWALLLLLRVRGIDPGAFFARALGGEGTGTVDPMAQLKLETRRLGEPPEIVVSVRDLLLGQGWEPLAEIPETARKLDDLRYQSPDEARESTYGELIQVAHGILPPSWGVPLLAVYGSALRMDARLLDQAQLTLMAAYEIAEKTGDASTLGNLVQRSAYVVADRGEHQQALGLAKGAEGFYVLAHDLTGIGKTLVDQGGWLYYLDRFQESIKVNLASLEYLPEDAKSNRFTALACLGEDYFFLGDLNSAQSYVEKAEAYSSSVGPWLCSQLGWSKARIEAVKKDTLAETHFRQVVEYFFEVSPIPYALSSVELTHILLAQGKMPEAYSVAMDTLRVIDQLEDNKLAFVAMVEFWRCANTSQGLTRALTEKTIREVARAGAMKAPTPMFKLPQLTGTLPYISPEQL